MIIIMAHGATDEDIRRVTDRIEQHGYRSNISRGAERTIIGAIGDIDEREKQLLAEQIETLGGVERVVLVLRPYKLVSLEVNPERTRVRVGDHVIGGRCFTLMAGPCSVESEEQILSVARAVQAAGAHLLRGGAYKPRTSPYDFQGLQAEGLQLLELARSETGLPIVTEVLAAQDVDRLADRVDMFQIGTRNMQNFALLRAVGRTQVPVLLKRGMSATIEEWLKAAEYILAEGNHQVVLCERGIRTFETYTRNTMDLSAVVAVKQLSHLPIIVDPSQGCGRRDMVVPLSRGAAAVGCDGLIVEVHPDPARAWSDAKQQITPEEFCQLVQEIDPILQAVGRTLRE